MTLSALDYLHSDRNYLQIHLKFENNQQPTVTAFCLLCYYPVFRGTDRQPPRLLLRLSLNIRQKAYSCTAINYLRVGN